MPLLPSGSYRKTRGIIRRGSRANQPLATTVLEGTLYYVTDEKITERSNGTAWESFSSIPAPISNVYGITNGLDGIDGENNYDSPIIIKQGLNTDLLDAIIAAHVAARC